MNVPVRRKRTPTTDLGENRKKKKNAVNVRDYLDVEALEGSSSDEDRDSEDYFIQDTVADADDATARSFDSNTFSHHGQGMDHRLADVINRYEARSADGDHCSGKSGSENEMAPLAERLRQWPKDTDPGLWRVRILDGSEKESYWAVQNRLLARPKLASSLILPPSGRMWIGIESPSRANVEELCFNLSTVHHPLEISLVPVEERVAWLDWHPTRSLPMSPSWVRLRKRSKLENMDIESGVMKYTGDLAFVLDAQTPCASQIILCLVPRLPVAIEGGASGYTKKRRRRLPRLLHPKAIGGVKEALEIAGLDPNIWWQPGRRHELEIVEDKLDTIVYRFAKDRRGDRYMPPFAVFPVPVEALCSADATPRLTELKMFFEGMAIESNKLDFPAPSREFIRWTYERYVAAPIEIGNRVEVNLKPGTVRGVIVDVLFGQVVVHLDDAEEIQVEVEHVRRRYEVSDAVKVITGSNYNCEGWVVNVEDDNVAVFDRELKEEFHVKTWQLVPHDSFEWGVVHRFQVGDTVQVNSPISPHHRDWGMVCNVNDLCVEVIEHNTNMKFAVPPWFLELENAKDRIMEKSKRSHASYDRYKELVNTWVVITGKHPEKGLYGRIREHLGNEIMRVEARSGTKVVDVHVDFLLTSGGRDVRQYHVGRYNTSSFLGYAIPNFERMPERATTPTQEPVAFEDAPGTPPIQSESTAEEAPDAPPTHSESADSEIAAIMISYGGQALPVNWLMKHGLMTKRIFANVHNTFSGGFANGAHEGDRVLVLSGERLDEIQVHMPTAKGQVVVVISGDMAGEVYVTREPNENGSFPLVHRGGKGAPKLVVEPKRLARCDPK
ncbi:hypothetical protein F5887DRAFT_1076332 [Amanita rubescens]|nr:hypothetical protein F5887DRAFT_1076332 [Amanita rubescens]